MSTSEYYSEEETVYSDDEKPNFNITKLNDKNSESKVTNENLQNESEFMTSKASINEDMNRGDEGVIDEEQVEELNEEGKKKVDEGIIMTREAAMNSDPQSVIRNAHALYSLIALTPADFKNEVIAKVADSIKDMKIGYERVFKDEKQLMNFLRGIFTGQPSSKSKHVDKMMKRAKLTQHMNINPVLRRRLPRPLTPSGNFVYHGNSKLTVC